MAIQLKASKAFLRKSVANKITDGNTITTSLTENEDVFSNLPYKTPDLSSINDKLSKDNTAAQSGDKTAGAVLKSTEGEWKLMFGKTADAVSLQANGSREVILQAGVVPTSSNRQKKQKPERVANLEAAPGKGKGTCTVSADAQPGVNGYIALVADDSVKMTMNGDVLEMDANGIKIFMKASSRRAMQLDGLPSVKEFCVTMLTFNSAGSSPLAPSIEVTPQ